MAGFPTIETEIGGRRYEIRVLPAKEGKRALTRLFKRLSPAIGELIKGQGGAEKDLNLLDMDVSAALAKLGHELEDDDVDYFCDLFGRYSSAESEPGNGKMVPVSDFFDHIFTGRYTHMMRWLWACLEANFKDFLAGPGALVSGLQGRSGDTR